MVGPQSRRDSRREDSGLADNIIFNSCDLSFVEEESSLLTGAIGTLLSINTQEDFRYSWSCIAPFGQTIEVRGRALSGHNRSYASMSLVIILEMGQSHK